MSSSGSNSCSSRSGYCAFCGESLRNTPTPIPVAYGAPSEEGRGTFTKLKPLRWRFLTTKAPRTKFICMACAEKRQMPQKTDQSVSLESSWDGRNSKQHKSSEQPLKLEHLEPHETARQRMQQNAPVRSKPREKRQERPSERCGNRQSTRESVASSDRGRGSSQTSDAQQEPARRSSGVLQPFANYRISSESIRPSRPASMVNVSTRPCVTKQRASVETIPSRTQLRNSSNGQTEPRGSEKKGPRLSSTADILGMSRSLELPPTYFDMGSSPTFSAVSAPEHDVLDWRQLEMQLPQAEPRKTNETEEERQRRRSASYAHMLLRMRRHYDAVQVNGTQGPPATAPPRRIRVERRANSVAVRSAKEDVPVKVDPANFAIDLEYLRAFKDAC